MEIAKLLCVPEKGFAITYDFISKGGENMNMLKQFLKEEDGMGTVEIILIIVVLVGLVILFKEEITGIVEDLFDQITSQTSSF